MVYIINDNDKERLEALMRDNGIKIEGYEYASEASIAAELKFVVGEVREGGVTPENEQRLCQIEENLEHIAKTMMEDNEYLFCEITDTVSNYISDVLGGLSLEIEDVICNDASAR